MKRATSRKFTTSTKTKYFNPRPREEGDAREEKNNDRQNISIHALVKRATCENGTWKAWACISIHALVKRATYALDTRATVTHISIHALVKRATTYRPSSKSVQFISIHALVKRATQILNASWDKIFEEFPIFEISIHALVKRATI